MLASGHALEMCAEVRDVEALLLYSTGRARRAFPRVYWLRPEIRMRDGSDLDDNTVVVYDFVVYFWMGQDRVINIVKWRNVQFCAGTGRSNERESGCRSLYQNRIEHRS